MSKIAKIVSVNLLLANCLIDEKSTLVQVMSWYCQAMSHYLSQCWPRSMSQYGVTRPLWVQASFVYWSTVMLPYGITGVQCINQGKCPSLPETEPMDDSQHLWGASFESWGWWITSKSFDTSGKLQYKNTRQGPVSLTIFCPQFKFDGNFALL